MGCGGGGQTSTTTTTQSVPPEVLSAYTGLLNRGQAVANLPLQQWQGPTIAGFNPTQQAAFNTVNQAQGMALPWINAATQYAGIGAAPVFPNVMQWNPTNLAQFENPFTGQVTQATQALFNEQNAEQMQNVRGSAIQNGVNPFGGDREAIAEAETARQQALAQNPTLAQLQAQGFTTAAGLLGQQQQLQLQGGEGDAWRAANAAAQLAGLGEQAQAGQLAGASAQLQTGALGQQLEQQELNVPIAQFQQQQAFPYQTTNFLQGLVEGIGPAFGGSSATTAPGPNLFGQAAGLGIAGFGVANQLGAFNSGEGATLNAAKDAFVAAPSDEPVAARGGRTTNHGSIDPRRAMGGLVPGFSTGLVPDMTAGDMADIEAAVALAGGSPVPALAPSGAHGLPFSSPSSTTTGSGGGQDQTLQTIGTIASIAAMAASDPALKHVKGSTDRALDRIRALTVRDARYRWEPPRTERPMLMADNVEDVMPQAVAGKAPGRMVNMNEIVPTLVQGIKELDQRTRRASGGPVGPFDGSGTSPAPFAPNPAAAPPTMMGVDPRLQQLYARYAQVPAEQLQRLAVMMPAQSLQGTMIRRALAAKQMAPASMGAFPSLPGATLPQGFPSLGTVASTAPTAVYASGGGAGGQGERILDPAAMPMFPSGTSIAPATLPRDARGPMLVSTSVKAPGYGINLPQATYFPGATGVVGPTSAPGQALLNESSSVTTAPAGFGGTPAAPNLVTPLPASVLSPPAPAAAAPNLSPFSNPFPTVDSVISAEQAGSITANQAQQLIGMDLGAMQSGTVSGVQGAQRGGGVRHFDGGGDVGPANRGINFDDPLIAIGAGMMASRSPFPLTQLGEGMEFATHTAPQRPFALAHRRFYAPPFISSPMRSDYSDPVGSQP